MAKYCDDPLVAIDCKKVLKSMQQDGLALDDILEFVLTRLHITKRGVRNSICLPFVNDTAFDGFTQFAIEYIRTSALWECYLTQLEREPEDNFATILLNVASDMPPGPEKDRCDGILWRLTQDERLSTITRNTLSLYTSSLPEVMPKQQWEPFEITVIHGYSSQARQMERAETFGHRHILANPEPCTLMPYKPVTSVKSILQRADQTTCIFNNRDLQKKKLCCSVTISDLPFRMQSSFPRRQKGLQLHCLSTRQDLVDIGLDSPSQRAVVPCLLTPTQASSVRGYIRGGDAIRCSWAEIPTRWGNTLKNGSSTLSGGKFSKRLICRISFLSWSMDIMTGPGSFLDLKNSRLEGAGRWNGLRLTLDHPVPAQKNILL